ncbi:MAG: hypothetical protein QOH89_259 [Pseudonocardiales bacterium]|jgi:hypothetical protein|nr:hypothetical protein [Pseudonocardiales bacterium]
MSWQDAHRYNRALREIETELNWTEGTELVWRPEYREIFGSPERLLLALRSRLQTTLYAQLDDLAGPSGPAPEVMRTLAAAHPGVVRALALPGAIRWIDADPAALAVSAA